MPYAPGGGADVAGRTIANQLQAILGQPFIVENRGGANGNIGAEFVAKSPADGHTLLVASSPVVTSPFLFNNLRFDGRKDFSPVARIGSSPLVLVVPAASPMVRLKDFKDATKLPKEGLSYGSAGNGSSGHLAGLLFTKEASVDALHVPYKGGAPALTDLIGGRLSFMLLNVVEVLPHVKAGTLRAIAVASAERSPLFPSVPTTAEEGLPAVDVAVWWNLVAPAGTPASAIQRLNAAANKGLENAAIRSQFEGQGTVISIATPEQTALHMKSETEKWGKLITTTGVRGE